MRCKPHRPCDPCSIGVVFSGNGGASTVGLFTGCGSIAKLGSLTKPSSIDKPSTFWEKLSACHHRGCGNEVVRPPAGHNGQHAA